MYKKLLVLFIHLFLFLICLVTDSSFITSYGSFLYALQLFIFVIVVYRGKHNMTIFLSPSFLTITYILLNFIFGHYAVVNALGLDRRYFLAYQSYTSINFITFYFLCCNLLLFLTIPFEKITKLYSSEKIERKIEKSKSTTFVHLSILLLVLFVLGRLTIDFSFLGGEGSFNYSFELTTAMAIVLIVRNQSLKNKLLIYGVLLAIFVTNHFDSKREILFVLIFLVLFEAIRSRLVLRLKIKTMIVSCFITVIAVMIIVLSSILRGYGNYDVESPIEALGYVDDYLTSDFAKDALVMNFEVTPVYGNSTNAVDYVYNNKVNLLYGSTFYKLFFLPIPRSVYPEKPESMVAIYTSKFAPSFRAIGGSFPILIYSEVFWNFHIFGLIFLGVIFYLINRMYTYILDGILNDKINTTMLLYLFLYSTLIQFVRGAGIEMWLVYALISFPLMIIYVSIFFKRRLR